jgi:hypothetical protein
MNREPLFTPLSEIRTAATTISGGLLDHDVVSPERWDDAVTILASAHDQVGGPARRHLYEVFAAAYDDPVQIARPLAALLDSLGATRRPAVNGEQLCLFDRDSARAAQDDEVIGHG